MLELGSTCEEAVEDVDRWLIGAGHVAAAFFGILPFGPGHRQAQDVPDRNLLTGLFGLVPSIGT